MKQVPALVAAIALTAAAFVGVVAGPAQAAESYAFSVDDFNGNAMGTRTLVQPVGYGCDVTDSTKLTQGTGTLRVDVKGEDDRGCTFASAQILWTAATTVDIQQGGADRISLNYSSITPVRSSAVTFGLQLVDVNGRVANVGGLTRNGGKASDFLTIRYGSAYEGDVAVFRFDAAFDKQHVKSVRLSIAAVKNKEDISVTFEGIGTNVGEPAYQQPSINADALYTFVPNTKSTYTFSVTGNPAPDVTVSGNPSWMTASAVKGDSQTTVTLSGNPGSVYMDSTINVYANVANSLTADRDVRVVVPSPIDVDYTTTSTELGEAEPVVLGTATAVPDAGIVGTPTGLPAGTSLGVSGTDVVLTGTPTESGSFAISARVGGSWLDAQFARTLVVGESASLDAIDDLVLVQDAVTTPLSLSATGYPAPTFSSTDLPAGLTLSSGGVLSGTPTESATSSVTVTATNSFGAEDQTFQITVGEEPTLEAIGDVALVRGQQITPISLVAAGFPASTLTTSTLPAGLTLTADGAIEGIATSTGVTDVAVTATNSLGVDTETFQITVGTVPVLDTVADVDLLNGVEMAPMALSGTGYPAPMFSSADLPAGLTLSSGGVLSGTPTESATTPVTVTATNSFGSDDQTFQITVGEEPTLEAIGDVALVRGQQITPISLVADGFPASTLTTSTLPAGLTLTAGGVIEGTPTTIGVTDVTVTATNSLGVDTETFQITVGTVPVLDAVADVDLVKDAEITPITLVADGFPASTLTTSTLPAGLTLTAGGVIEGTPTASATTLVTVTATNSLGVDTATFQITVGEEPTLDAIGDVALVRGQPITPIASVVTGYPAPTFSSTTLPAGLTLAADGQIEGTPTATGVTEVTVSATNVFGVQEQTFEIRVGDSPVVTLPTAVEIVAFGPYSLPVEVNDADAVVTASGLPAGITVVNDAGEVTLAGTATLGAGINALAGVAEVSATSEFGTSTVTLDWTVVRHEAPVITAPDEVRFTLGDDVDIAIGATGLPAPTVSVQNLPAGLSWVSGAGGGSIVGTPTAAGSFTVTVVAANGVGADARVPVTIVVELPVLSLELPASTARPGESVQLSGSGFLPGAGVHVWLHSEPVLIATGVANAAGELSLSVVIPTDTPAGDHTVVVVADSGATASAPLTVLAVAEDDVTAPDGSDTPENSDTPDGADTPDDSDTSDDSDTAGDEVAGDDRDPTSHSSESAGADESAQLSATGSDWFGLAAAALLALAIGSTALVVRRQRR